MAMLSPWCFFFIIIITVCQYVSCEYEQYEAIEEDNITLQCRFELDPELRKSLVYVWRRIRNSETVIVVSAIFSETNYHIFNVPAKDRFDLTIINVTYERDNGQFECEVKAIDSEETLHSQGYNLVVLSPPDLLIVTSEHQVLAQEGRQLNLTCSSTGGIPSPDIKWYRDDSKHALNTEMIIAKTPKGEAMATLTLVPSREDDGAIFRCIVRNRAMREDQRLEFWLELMVNSDTNTTTTSATTTSATTTSATTTSVTHPRDIIFIVICCILLLICPLIWYKIRKKLKHVNNNETDQLKIGPLQNQSSENYYYKNGTENEALENAMNEASVVLAMDVFKNIATQGADNHYVVSNSPLYDNTCRM